MPAIKPVLTEGVLGDRGWSALHRLIRLRGREPDDQAIHLILYALDRHLAGEDVELSQERLEALLDDNPELVA